MARTTEVSLRFVGVEEIRESPMSGLNTYFSTTKQAVRDRRGDEITDGRGDKVFEIVAHSIIHKLVFEGRAKCLADHEAMALAGPLSVVDHHELERLRGEDVIMEAEFNRLEALTTQERGPAMTKAEIEEALTMRGAAMSSIRPRAVAQKRRVPREE